MRNKIKILILKMLYPNKDLIWKSRRWNLTRTDYIDLGGEK